MKLLTKILLIPLVLCLTACGEYSKTDYALGTSVNVTIYSGGNAEDADAAIKMIHDLEKVLSRNVSGSEIDRINKAGEEGVKVSDTTAHLIKRGIYYSDMSGGKFDITIGKITKLWGFGKNSTPPDKETLKRACQEVGYKQISIKDNTVFLSGGAELDLGGIAKGYIADLVSQSLKERGVKSAIINLGGNVLAIGDKGGRPFKVGIQSPFLKDGILCTVNISDKSVVTSGIYERQFEYGGQKYHHLINPETGYPEDNALASVTVIADSSADADALATVLYMDGEAGIEKAEKIDGIEAIFVFRDGSVRATDGARYEMEDL